jgi:hypothetical protein
VFARTRAQLESFKRQTEAQLDARAPLLQAAQELEGPPLDAPQEFVDRFFPQHTTACHGFGTCPFLGPCQVGRAAAVTFKRREPDYVDRQIVR